MPKTADTNWGVKSDTKYAGKTQNDPLTLSKAQALNQANEPTAHSFQGQSSKACPSGMVLQRTGNRNLIRYKQLKTKIEAESTHAVKLSNGCLLRKSGVAARKSNTPKKRLAVGRPKPRTPAGLRKKLAESTKLARRAGLFRREVANSGGTPSYWEIAIGIGTRGTASNRHPTKRNRAGGSRVSSHRTRGHNK